MQIDPACADNFNGLTLDEIRPFNLGFLWNDFNAEPNDNLWTYCDKGRGFVMGRLLTQNILEKYSAVCTVKGINERISIMTECQELLIHQTWVFIRFGKTKLSPQSQPVFLMVMCHLLNLLCKTIIKIGD